MSRDDHTEQAHTDHGLEQRCDYALAEHYKGIAETCRIDWCTHSVFARGCLTGPNHSGVELHGFLSHLIKIAVNDETYMIFGYRVKQVRDQMHSEDVVSARRIKFS